MNDETNGSVAGMRVSDVMSRDVVACSRDTAIAVLAKTMATHQTHAIAVLDERRRPVGVVSDVDLLAGEWLGTDWANLAMLRATTAADLMSTPAQTVRAGETVEGAVQRIRELRIARLLVVDEQGAAAGVLSVSDLIARLSRPRVHRRCVSDVMSHAIVTCRPEAPMHAAVRAMVERRSRSVVVTDGDRAVGVLTGGDALALYATPTGARSSGTVAEFMSTPAITATPDLPLSEAADRMLTHEIHRLIVVDAHDERGPLGVISTADIVVEMADDKSVWQTPAAG
jgi:CBS domain-containing protein